MSCFLEWALFFPFDKVRGEHFIPFRWKLWYSPRDFFFPQAPRLGDVRCVKKSFWILSGPFSPKAWQNSTIKIASFLVGHCFFMVSFLARGRFFNYPKLDAHFFAICEDDSSGSPGMDMFAAWVSWPWICLATLDFFLVRPVWKRGKPWGVNHGHWNRKPRKGGPRILGYHVILRLMASLRKIT